ncbi:hypothetical protein EMIT0P291_110112 [Pseudomonas sp. IT-P291]
MHKKMHQHTTVLDLIKQRKAQHGA